MQSERLQLLLVYHWTATVSSWSLTDIYNHCSNQLFTAKSKQFPWKPEDIFVLLGLLCQWTKYLFGDSPSNFSGCTVSIFCSHLLISPCFCQPPVLDLSKWSWETTASSPGLVVENEEEGTATNKHIKHSCLAINLTLPTGMLPWHLWHLCINCVWRAHLPHRNWNHWLHLIWKFFWSYFVSIKYHSASMILQTFVT